MSGILQVLLVGLPDQLTEALMELAQDNLNLVTVGASRPAAAVRRFDAMSPDAVAIGIGEVPEQAALLSEAIRGRPLGALVPLIMIDLGQSPPHALTTPSGAAEAGADQFFAPGTPAPVLLTALAHLMDIELPLPVLAQQVAREASGGPSPGKGEPNPAMTADFAAVAQKLNDQPNADPNAERQDGGATVVRVTDDPVVHHATAAQPHDELTGQGRPWSPTPRVPRSVNLRHMGDSGRMGAVTPEAIRRKLRQARHEDYYTLMDVRKGVDELQIEQAYRRLRGRFEPTRLPRPLADRHFHELQEICDALDDAFAVLAAGDLREAYLRSVLQTPEGG